MGAWDFPAVGGTHVVKPAAAVVRSPPAAGTGAAGMGGPAGVGGSAVVAAVVVVPAMAEAAAVGTSSVAAASGTSAWNPQKGIATTESCNACGVMRGVGSTTSVRGAKGFWQATLVQALSCAGFWGLTASGCCGLIQLLGVTTLPGKGGLIFAVTGV